MRGILIIILSNGLYSNAGKIVTQLKINHGYTIITDSQIITRTAAEHNIKPSIIKKIIQSRPVAFNDFTHEKEKCLACLKQVMSKYLGSGNYLLHGILGHLIPVPMPQVMRILITADRPAQIKHSMDSLGYSKKETLEEIKLFDRYAILWTKKITGKKFFDESLYDIVIPGDKFSVSKSIKLIMECCEKFNTISRTLVNKKIADFELACKVEIAMAGTGSKLYVESDDGSVLITIDKSVMMLAKFKQKITHLAQKINGVKSVKIKLGKNYYLNTIIRPIDIGTPARLLLVDDEKEFVQTLSERLKLRQFPSEIAYTGEEALKLTSKEDMDVMILDLKMPGIDGFEVLKKIKKTKPHIEVIILTGHGSEEDRKKCMELGAFAYLQKPADIDMLTIKMKEAYAKISAEKLS